MEGSFAKRQLRHKMNSDKKYLHTCITSPRLHATSFLDITLPVCFSGRMTPWGKSLLREHILSHWQGTHRFPISSFAVAMTSTMERVLQNPNADPCCSAWAQRCYRSTSERRKLLIEEHRESKDICFLFVI